MVSYIFVFHKAPIVMIDAFLFFVSTPSESTKVLLDYIRASTI